MPGCRDDARDGVLDLPPRRVLRVGGDRPGERGAAPSTPRPPAIGGSTTPVSVGSGLLGLAVTALGKVAVQSRHCPARHRSGVAPPRLPALLAVEVQAKPGRPPEAYRRDSPPDSPDGPENPTWGRRRIRAELALLGYRVAELTVARYMHRPSPGPSPTGRAFLATHARDIVAVDFFLVSTLTFRLLFVFIVLRRDRRELIHRNVTDGPAAC
jgi:hypothetical protein